MTSSDALPAAVLKRKAVVYVRQSTQAQVQTNLSWLGLVLALRSCKISRHKPHPASVGCFAGKNRFHSFTVRE